MAKRKFKGWLAGIFMASALILPSHTLTVSAFTNEAGQENGESVETEKAEKKTVVREEKPKDTEKTPFSVSGNGQLADDISDDGTKQFLTIQTENGSTFFIVVDRSRDEENVYMLSPVDENDLAEFLDEKEKEPEPEMTEVLDIQPGADTDEDAEPENPEPETESGGIGAGTVLALALLAAGGTGAYCYLKIVRPKRDDEDAKSENLEFSDNAAFVKDAQDDEEDDDESKDENEET